MIAILPCFFHVFIIIWWVNTQIHRSESNQKFLSLISYFQKSQLKSETCIHWKINLYIKIWMLIMYYSTHNHNQESIAVGCVPPTFVVRGEADALWRETPGGIVTLWSYMPLEGDPSEGRWNQAARQEATSYTLMWTKWQTGVKTLPSRNFIGEQ